MTAILQKVHEFLCSPLSVIPSPSTARFPLCVFLRVCVLLVRCASLARNKFAPLVRHGRYSAQYAHSDASAIFAILLRADLGRLSSRR